MFHKSPLDLQQRHILCFHFYSSQGAISISNNSLKIIYGDVCHLSLGS